MTTAFFEIKNRWTGEVMLRVEADSLRGANLEGADLQPIGS